ncbi:hypothetical protein CR513_07003, partial [Mucuna pruriens]
MYTSFNTKNLRESSCIYPTPIHILLMSLNGEKLFKEVYTNINYTRSNINRRSTSMYHIFFGGNLVTWWTKN